MELIMFDVDGTLTISNEIDTECYISAVKKALKINYIDSDWSKYKYITDSGISTEIFEQYFHRKPRSEELDLIKNYFVQNLKSAFLKPRNYCTEVNGAISAFNKLKNHKNYALSLATGTWRESAELKLKNAGFDYSEIPFASSDDSIEREKIMLLALDKAKIKYNVQSFNLITYIGDGVWDLFASQNLGFNFIGISENNNKQKLIEAGAKFIIPNFKDFNKFLDILKSFN